MRRGLTVVVLYEGETAKKYHQELYSLPDARYYAIEGAVTDAVLDASGHRPRELHISAQWETMTLLALWSRSVPAAGNVLDLLGEPGIGDSLSGPGAADIRGVFSLLCHSGRLDLLRRVCKAAKSKAESMCGERISVHCHLASDEAEKIIASSL